MILYCITTEQGVHSNLNICSTYVFPLAWLKGCGSMSTLWLEHANHHLCFVDWHYWFIVWVWMIRCKTSHKQSCCWTSRFAAVPMQCSTVEVNQHQSSINLDMHHFLKKQLVRKWRWWRLHCHAMQSSSVVCLKRKHGCVCWVEWLQACNLFMAHHPTACVVWKCGR